MITGSISYRELPDSPRWNFTRSGSEGNRRFRVAWENKEAFAAQLIGSATLAGGQSVIDPPDPFPWNQQLVANEVEITPWMDDPGLPATAARMGYQWALVTAKYGTSTFSATRADLARMDSYDFSGEFLTLPTDKLYYQGGAGEKLAPETPFGKLIPGLEFTVERKGLAALRKREILELLGCVNSGPFDESAGTDSPVYQLGLPPGSTSILTLNRDGTNPPETVLFIGAAARQAVDPAGRPKWDLTLKFSIRQQSWNTIYDVKTLAWRGIQYAENNEGPFTEVKPYLPGDLSVLLR